MVQTQSRTNTHTLLDETLAFAGRTESKISHNIMQTPHLSPMKEPMSSMPAPRKLQPTVSEVTVMGLDIPGSVNAEEEASEARTGDEAQQVHPQPQPQEVQPRMTRRPSFTYQSKIDAADPLDIEIDVPLPPKRRSSRPKAIFNASPSAEDLTPVDDDNIE